MQMLKSISGLGAVENNEIETDWLKLRGRTLILMNTIFQISNLSAVEVIDLSTIKSIPGYYWLMLLGGLLLLAMGGTYALVGVVLLGIAGYLFYQHYQNRLTERYGLRLVTNSGEARILVSHDRSFLVKVALSLYAAINNEDEVKAINYNFIQRQIEVGSVTDSTFVAGDVKGDVVNSI